MLKRKRLLSFIMVLLLVFSFVVPVNKVDASTKYVEVTKTLSSTEITTKDEVEVTLGIKGTPPVNVVQPNDVILILDKSGSMRGEKIIQAKEASKDFTDLIDLTKHRVGVVDYSTSSSKLPLTTDADRIKNYIDTIQFGGNTNTADAIRTSITELSNRREEAQPVIIILTDGAANSTEEAKLAAEEAKAAGIVFYTVALLDENDNPDGSAQNLLLKEMATTAQHHHFVLGATGLNEVYKQLVKEIGITSVRDVAITDIISPEFEIVPGSFEQNIPRPTVSGNTLTWNFLELKSDILNFTYKIRPKSKDIAGTFPVSTGSTIKYKNYLGDTESFSIVNPNIKIKYPKPDIISVTPDKNEITGGNEITIMGTDFRTGATVTVNSVAATNVQVISENEIKAMVPAGKQGDAVIRVKNPDGQYDEEKSYYFVNPIVTTITPDKGLVDGGSRVEISGKYFLRGVKVFFNDIEATTTYLNAQSITAITPKSDNVGEVDVKVINPDGTEIIVSNGFIYERAPAPIITSISPNEGKLAGGEIVDIYGDNFSLDAKVKVGGQDVSRIVFIEKTRARIVVPASTVSGPVDVLIINSDGQEVILKDGYNYLAPVADPAPVITSISPNEGKLAGGEIVDIYGDNFSLGAKVKVGGQDATRIVFVEKTRVRVVVPGATVSGPVDVLVINSDGQEVTLKDGYNYLAPVADLAPVITSISLNEGQLAGGEIVDIYGENFKVGATVKIGGQDASRIVFVEKTRARIVVPAATTAGPVDIVFTNPDGQIASLQNSYTYLPLPQAAPPAIKSLSKVEGLISGGDYVIVNGTGFQKGLTVTLGGIEANVINYYSSTQIRIAIPASLAEGTVELVITNPDGQIASLANAYTYLPLPEIAPPVIKYLSEITGPINGGNYVIVNGTGFQKGLTVTLGGIEATIINYYNANQIRIAIPKGTNPGVVALEITNPDGKSDILNSAYTYTIPVMTITSLSVGAGEFKGGYSTTIYGINFDSSSVVTVNDIPVKTTYYSTTQMKINAMPSAKELGLSDVGGVVEIKVTNSLGSFATIDFIYKEKPAVLVPNITQMTGAGGAEAAGSIAGGNYIYFYGTGFTNTMKVRIYDDSNVLVKEEVLTNFYNATYSRKLMPKVDTAGNYIIKLVNIDGIESNGMTYIYR